MAASALDWNDIDLVLALARHGSMTAAARGLGVDVSTVSRRLAAAEAALGTRLFIRDHRGYRPTDAGAVFAAHAERVQGAVRALEAETRAEAEEIAGPVAITAAGALFDQWLVERLPELTRVHPRLQIRLIADDHNLSFMRREADLALRLAQPTQDAALLMRKLGTIGFSVYSGARAKPVPRERWGSRPWLAYGDELSAVPEMQWLARLNPVPQRRVQSSSATTLIHACRAGLGLALLPDFCGARNGLRRLSAKPELHRDVWLLSHRDAAKIRRFRVVGDWLARAFEADRRAFAG
jgi:DNA-binding transcriptional LysR family regulator